MAKDKMYLNIAIYRTSIDKLTELYPDVKYSEAIMRLIDDYIRVRDERDEFKAIVMRQLISNESKK